MNLVSLARIALLLSIGCNGHAASAQPAMDPAMCDKVAALPNAPMTAESCRRMMTTMGTDDPSSHRPGDDALTCAQIHAEMVKRQPKGVSAAEAARQEKQIEDGRTLSARRGAETAAQTAPHVAAQTAIAMTPMPNAAATALNAPHQAEIQRITGAAGQRYLAEQRQSTAGAADVIGSKLGHDPRLMHLAQLSAGKRCKH
ncbi:MAG: hypothetical protein ABIQ33_10485 [Caldimonas sp.]